MSTGVEAPRSVVITGAGRGLGFASAVHLHRAGWHVVAAVRSVEEALGRLAAALGVEAGDPRLTGVRLDLLDRDSVTEAAEMITKVVGAPDALVHNAGLAAAGCIEDLPWQAWQDLFHTNLFGPVLLTNALLPTMRKAGRGRIVLVSSQAGARGVATAGAYGASKAAAERWAEALAHEVAPFGLGVTVLVAGTFDTDILVRTVFHQQPDSAYQAFKSAVDSMEAGVHRLALPPDRFARALHRALDDTAPYARRAVGRDARLLLAARRLLPDTVLHRLTRAITRIPGPGTLRP